MHKTEMSSPPAEKMLRPRLAPESWM